jgi:hypothetical protein
LVKQGIERVRRSIEFHPDDRLNWHRRAGASIFHCMSRAALIAVALLACAPGRWESPRARHPASKDELASCRVTIVADEPLRDELKQALARQGFGVVEHPAWHGDLELKAAPGLAVLRSDDFFVDQVRAPDAAGMAQALAMSRRVRDFVRDSGTVEQRNVGE